MKKNEKKKKKWESKTCRLENKIQVFDKVEMNKTEIS